MEEDQGIKPNQGGVSDRRMLGGRPVFVLFGSSIVQYSFSNGGWGATLADIYARKVRMVWDFYSGVVTAR